ncbi:MAG: hypothetical protein VYD19_04460 [Myxococcota bacterium]|nr:hypothetical protein [Myxococcota bacterium]
MNQRHNRRPASRERRVGLSLFALTLLLCPSCTMDLPSDRRVEQACRAEVKLFAQSRPFSLLESDFFTDKKARGLLRADLLERLNFHELKSDMIQSRYVMRFAFTLPNGQRLVLKNSEQTGGLSLTNANERRYEIECESAWNRFSEQPLRTKIEVKSIDMEPWVDQMKSISVGLEDTESSALERLRERSRDRRSMPVLR